jgi:hypothetical protein
MTWIRIPVNCGRCRQERRNRFASGCWIGPGSISRIRCNRGTQSAACRRDCAIFDWPLRLK